MAFEYQQMDVTNESVSMITGWMSQFGWNLKNSQRVFSRSSRPIGAITYQNFTYIQTETEVEDFTELLFERDLDMTFYDEVLELEQEANYLMEYHTEARPLPCPPPKSYDEWYKINKPSPFGLGTQILIAIISAIVLGVTIGLLCRLRYDKEFVEGLFTPIFITAIVLSIIISCALKAFVRSFNKNNKSSSCYKKMYAEYEAYCNAINEKNLRVELYDRARKRIPEILNEVKKYLK